MRGLAAAWVVMIHSCDRFLAGDNLRYASEPLYAFSMRGQLGVIFFFVISGYCITAAAYSALLSGKPIWRYAYERARRIYPPYLVSLLLTVLAILLIGFVNAHHLLGPVHHLERLEASPSFWIANIFLLQSELNAPNVNVVSWSLCIEVAFYAVMGLWLCLAKLATARRNLAAGTMVLMAGVAATTAVSLTSLIITGDAIFPLKGWHYFGWGGVLFFLIESNAETVAGYSRKLRWTMNGTTALLIGLTVAFIALRPEVEVDMGHPTSQARSITCLLFCVFLLLARRYDERITSSKWMRPCLWLGACSYSLYLIHPVVIPFIEILCRKAGLGGGRYWISFWIQFAVAIACGRLFYCLVERHFVSSRQKKRLIEEHAA
jgi:peptidoglycan/LPS O-acetylase OafA/YrhL